MTVNILFMQIIITTNCNINEKIIVQLIIPSEELDTEPMTMKFKIIHKFFTPKWNQILVT